MSRGSSPPLGAGRLRATTLRLHIGFSVGSGWIAGRSAIEDLDALPEPVLDEAEVRALFQEALAPMRPESEARSDRALRQLQSIMFRYDISVWKSHDRLTWALQEIVELRDDFTAAEAPHVHELVRLKETEAMLLAAELILKASLLRTESRLSHFREDHDARDDENWLCWLDARDSGAPRTLSRRRSRRR